MADNVVSQVTFEIGQIDQLLAVYADLVERIQQRPPDLVEITAMASVLHFFYNGLEWGRLQGLVTSLREVWAQVKEDLHAFLGRLSSTENHQHGS